MFRHPIKKLFFSLFAASFLIVACASDEAKTVNIAGITKRVSPTDDLSRSIAQSSMKMLKEKSKDYRVGPGDLLEISVFEWELREETKTAVFRVAESGIVSLPVIGDIKVAGVAVAKIKVSLERRFRRGGFIREPRVSVDIKEFRSKLVGIVGAVRDPGVYTLRQNVTTLLDILSLAGGLSEQAGYIAYVIRSEQKQMSEQSMKDVQRGITGVSFANPPKKEIVTIDLYDLMEKGDLGLNMVLGDGDTVNVPEAQKFSVIGFARQPGSFPLKRPTTVLEGIGMAGGLIEREASPRECILKRVTSNGDVIVKLDLVDISYGKKPNIYLEPNDIIDVRQSTGKYFLLGLLDGIGRIFSFHYNVRE